MVHNKHARCSKHTQRTNPTDFRVPSHFGTCRMAPPQGGLGAASTPKPTPTPQGVCGKALTAGDSIRPPEGTRAQSVLILTRCGGGGCKGAPAEYRGPGETGSGGTRPGIRPSGSSRLYGVSGRQAVMVRLEQLFNHFSFSLR